LHGGVLYADEFEREAVIQHVIDGIHCSRQKKQQRSQKCSDIERQDIMRQRTAVPTDEALHVTRQLSSGVVRRKPHVNREFILASNKCVIDAREANEKHDFLTYSIAKSSCKTDHANSISAPPGVLPIQSKKEALRLKGVEPAVVSPISSYSTVALTNFSRPSYARRTHPVQVSWSGQCFEEKLALKVSNEAAVVTQANRQGSQQHRILHFGPSCIARTEPNSIKTSPHSYYPGISLERTFSSSSVEDDGAAAAIAMLQMRGTIHKFVE
jgi:hypothetical protein